MNNSEQMCILYMYYILDIAHNHLELSPWIDIRSCTYMYACACMELSSEQNENDNLGCGCNLHAIKRKEGR
ncbi:hypothetical protein POVWA2_055030 [Plasmodium ovale wallikeri]|uniref:Uncharacterized protein n=1 Tax=Plasmodium ovale wallikeri TaxID=864142 RepID=A0A1A8ZTM0_PLAOA|nr:hypothetical protein POVWA1_055330 [Plasmodium ovale wallikeri]SBT47958.1 hypothetical protein POVWA2_055030 [Plasmodium ovale wallikeri]